MLYDLVNVITVPTQRVVIRLSPESAQEVEGTPQGSLAATGA